jgi:hypothetical protein
MIHVAYIKTRGYFGVLSLRMAPKAKIGITHGQQLGIDGAVRTVAYSATFAQGSMLEDERSGLLTMTPGAGFVQAGHGQPSSRLHNVQAMRIVALNTIHLPFSDGMVFGKVERGVNVQMTLVAGLWIFPWINNELFPACTANGNVFTGGAMTGFAPVLTCHFPLGQPQPGVGAGGKNPADICVAIQAHLVAHKLRAFNFRGLNNGAVERRAGPHQQGQRDQPNPSQAHC